jgi:hypothetical protein
LNKDTASITPNCTECGATLDAQQKFCGMCGNEQICPICGTRRVKDQKFCGNDRHEFLSRSLGPFIAQQNPSPLTMDSPPASPQSLGSANTIFDVSPPPPQEIQRQKSKTDSPRPTGGEKCPSIGSVRILNTIIGNIMLVCLFFRYTDLPFVFKTFGFLCILWAICGWILLIKHKSERAWWGSVICVSILLVAIGVGIWGQELALADLAVFSFVCSPFVILLILLIKYRKALIG